MEIDVHQHMWPADLIDALRRRRTPPLLDDWTLKLPGEPDFLVSPADHDVRLRTDLAHEDGLGLVLLSLSSPLGIESLPYEEAQPLLDAFHEGGLSLPQPFKMWASISLANPDPAELSKLLKAGCVGLQLPATAMTDPGMVADLLPLLEKLQELNKPLFVHPGPVGNASGSEVPGWWPAIVPYVSQMHTAWFAYKTSVEAVLPRLRVCFAMLAGLAPLHGERCVARGGPTLRNPSLYVETSSYGPRAIAATVQAIGAAAIVNGSDRPYADQSDLGPDTNLREAVRVRNPRYLLDSDS
jgi:hypothetical protein